MRTPLILVSSLFLLLLGGTGCKTVDEGFVNSSLQVEEVFTKMEKALLSENYDGFASLWIPRAFKDNLAGAGGYAGDFLYDRATKARWYLDPDFSKAGIYQDESVFLVPCQESLREKDQQMGTLFVLLVNHRQRGFRILGCSEQKSSVQTLLERYIKDPGIADGKGR